MYLWTKQVNPWILVMMMMVVILMWRLKQITYLNTSSLQVCKGIVSIINSPFNNPQVLNPVCDYPRDHLTTHKYWTQFVIILEIISRVSLIHGLTYFLGLRGVIITHEPSAVRGIKTLLLHSKQTELDITYATLKLMYENNASLAL